MHHPFSSIKDLTFAESDLLRVPMVKLPPTDSELDALFRQDERKTTNALSRTI